MRAKLVAGNWKMHGSLSDNAKLLARWLRAARRCRSRAGPCACRSLIWRRRKHCLAGTPVPWGAQNVSQHAKGAYTGEVSAAMLREFGSHLRHRGALGAPRAVRRRQRDCRVEVSRRRGMRG